MGMINPLGSVIQVVSPLGKKQHSVIISDNTGYLTQDKC